MVAMMSGVIAPPLLIGAMCPATDPSCATQRLYLLQAAMIVSAISTAIQVTGYRVGSGHRIGNGLLSVMGITLTSTTVWQNAITDMMVGQ